MWLAMEIFCIVFCIIYAFSIFKNNLGIEKREPKFITGDKIIFTDNKRKYASKLMESDYNYKDEYYGVIVRLLKNHEFISEYDDNDENPNFHYLVKLLNESVFTSYDTTTTEVTEHKYLKVSEVDLSVDIIKHMLYSNQ